MLSSEENSRLYAYNGNEPYIFVSYAHKDSDIVLPIVHYLQQEGFRIWFDLGIESGTEWSNVIADHLTDCAVFLAFVSKSSVISENCLDELAFAKSHRKPSLMVFLEDDVVLPKGAEMQTARFQRMYRSRYQTDDYFCRKLCDTPMLAVCHDIPETPKSEPIPASAPTETPATPEKHRSVKTSRPQKRNIKLLLPVGILAVFLLAVGAWFLLSGPKEQVTSIPGDDSYGLELIASFSDPDHSVSLSSSIIYDTTDDPNTITLLNRKGESITNAVYRSVDALGNGLYTITSGEAFDPANPTLSAVNNISLVRDTGKVLIPVEACLIQRPSSSDADGRYLYVFYATAPAGESDVLISKNEHGTYTSSVSDSVDYSGYIKIFDTKTEKFLDKLPTITSLNAVKTCGDSILIKNQKVHTLYSAEGNAIGEFSGSVDVGKDFFILRDGSASRIYDSQGNQLFTANKNISIISGGHYLSVHQSGDSYILMDIYGNHLLDTPYSSFYKESADIFIVKNSGKYGLVTPAGMIIFQLWMLPVISVLNLPAVTRSLARKASLPQS